MPRTRLAVLALLAAVAALLSTPLTGSASAAVNPSAGPFPPGTNTCTSAKLRLHPYPVVLVHGTFEDAAQNWATLAPYLEARGYCVYALNYGQRGTQDIHASSLQLKTFIEKFVLPTSGASKVDIVGHSQGGMMPRYYLKFLGGTSYVDDLVGLSPSNHGTTNPGAFVAGSTFCEACAQQMAGSDFLAHLNAGDETPGAVSYTVLETKYDEVVTPYQSEFLAPGPRTANILLQDACPAEVIDHHEMPNDALAFRWTLQALGQPGPADPAHPPSCV
jgi:triacylglycerol lipase